MKHGLVAALFAGAALASSEAEAGWRHRAAYGGSSGGYASWGGSHGSHGGYAVRRHHRHRRHARRAWGSSGGYVNYALYGSSGGYANYGSSGGYSNYTPSYGSDYGSYEAEYSAPPRADWTDVSASRSAVPQGAWSSTVRQRQNYTYEEPYEDDDLVDLQPRRRDANIRQATRRLVRDAAPTRTDRALDDLSQDPLDEEVDYEELARGDELNRPTARPQRETAAEVERPAPRDLSDEASSDPAPPLPAEVGDEARAIALPAQQLAQASAPATSEPEAVQQTASAGGPLLISAGTNLDAPADTDTGSAAVEF